MSTMRTHIVMPTRLAKEIDALAGPRGRSAFFVELAENEVRKQRLLAFLDRDKPAWLEENHPEIAKQGAAAWVHNLRRERSPRQVRLEKMANEKGL